MEDVEIVFLMGIEHMVLHAHADSLLNGGVGRMMTNSRCWTPATGIDSQLSANLAEMVMKEVSASEIAITAPVEASAAEWVVLLRSP